MQIETMELHICPNQDCTKTIEGALPTCTALHTLVLVGASPLRLSSLAKASNLTHLALNFCAGMKARHLLKLKSLRWGALPTA